MSKPLRSKYANSTKRAFYFPDTNEKICAKCGVKTSTNNFFKHSQTQDGWHSWCKSCCKEGNKKSREKKYSSFEGRVTTFLRTCKHSALKRNNEFSLTRKMLLDMWEKQDGICVYTGIEMTTQPNFPYSVSVERINSNVGYTKENTVLVCNAINKMKTDLDPVLFFEMCSVVTKFLGDKNGNLNVEFIK